MVWLLGKRGSRWEVEALRCIDSCESEPVLIARGIRGHILLLALGPKELFDDIDGLLVDITVLVLLQLLQLVQALGLIDQHSKVAPRLLACTEDSI